MAVSLDNLMNLGGAIASSEFGSNGEMVASMGDTSEEHAEIIELMGAANMLMDKMETKMEAHGRAERRAVECVPVKGWAVSAGDYSICVMGNAGVFVETDKADFKRIFKTLGRESGVL